MKPNEPQVIHPTVGTGSAPRPASGPVMDVQRPRPNPAPSQVTTPLDKPMAPADSITSATPDPGQVSDRDPLQQTTNPAAPKKKRTGLIVAIITLSAILLVAGGVAGFILYKNNNKPAPAVTEPISDSQRVNVEEIDATTSEIDQALNSLNDSTDVTPNDVTDQTLGL